MRIIFTYYYIIQFFHINKFDIDELKLPNSISNCKFSAVNKNLSKLPLIDLNKKYNLDNVF